MTRPAEISGVLLVDKAAGPTSFDVVRMVRRALGVKKAGHTGTLDPAATGLLPVCLGDATRIVQFITDGDKEYVGVVRFGITTDTLDGAGAVLETRDATHLTREVVEESVRALVGAQQQVPPMYSALKVDGRRLYELAREGEEVEREARDIVVHEAELLDWNAPDATVRIRCTKGTYIRSLAETLGKKLGTGAHLASLRRTGSGTLRVEQALPLAELDSLDRATLLGRLVSVETALEDMPALQLDRRHAMSVAFGNPVDLDMQHRLAIPPQPPGKRVRITDPGGHVVAVGEADAEGIVKLLRVLRAAQGPGPRCG